MDALGTGWSQATTNRARAIADRSRNLTALEGREQSQLLAISARRYEAGEVLRVVDRVEAALS